VEISGGIELKCKEMGCDWEKKKIKQANKQKNKKILKMKRT
jgi:hypothetical protein